VVESESTGGAAALFGKAGGEPAEPTRRSQWHSCAGAVCQAEAATERMASRRAVRHRPSSGGFGAAGQRSRGADRLPLPAPRAVGEYVSAAVQFAARARERGGRSGT